jgi:hypothetical protein
MRQNVNKATGRADGAGGVIVRAFVVFSSLVSLCVSDGIGPRLVPYPSQPATERAASAARESRLSALRSETRAASEHQPKAVTPVWNNAALDRAAISPPTVRPAAQPDLYASPGYSFRNPSSTRGRAPPRNS